MGLGRRCVGRGGGVIIFFFQAEDGIRDKGMRLEFRRVLFRSLKLTEYNDVSLPDELILDIKDVKD